MTRRDPFAARQSGQAALIGVLAITLMMASIFTGLKYIGPKSTLGSQKAGPALAQTSTIQNAIWTFVARNDRLPCPADGSIAQGSANDGVEQINGASCSVGSSIAGSRGVVPWKTLGIGYLVALDGYGSRIGYAVSSANHPNHKPYTAPSFLSDSNLSTLDTVKVEAPCTIVINGAGSNTCPASVSYAYVLISFGKDHAGAYLTSGNRVSQPASTVNEYSNTLDTSFTATSGAFEVWPYNDSTTAGNSYFDDVLIYEKAEQIEKDIEFQNNQAGSGGSGGSDSSGGSGGSGGSSGGVGSANYNPNAPAQALKNTDAVSLAANTSTITNTYSCSAGSTYCPGSTNAGSLANTYSYTGCAGGASCAGSVSLFAGDCLAANGNLGLVCINDPVFNTGIVVGNAYGIENGDWIGPNKLSGCAQCSENAYNAYMIPRQTLTYNFTSSYRSFAFADYLVDGGMQVQVDGYQSQVYSITGNVTSGSTTIGNVSSAAGLLIGQSVVNTSLFSQGFSVITGIAVGVSSSNLTVSPAPTSSQSGASLTVVQNGFYITGSVTSGSELVTNLSTKTGYGISTSTGLSTGFNISGPGIPVGTTITGFPSNGLSISQSAYATVANANLFANPWLQIGTRIVSNGYATNIASGTPIAAITTSGSLSVTNVAPAGALAVGQVVAGPGIMPGTVITAVSTTTSSTTIALSSAPTQSETGYLTVSTPDFVPTPVTGDVTSGSNSVTGVSSTIGLVSGQSIAGFGIPASTLISGISGTTITLSQNATGTGTNEDLFVTSRLPITGVTGNFTANSSTVLSVSNTSGFAVNDHIQSPALATGTYISAIGTSSLTLSQNATATQSGAPVAVDPLNPAASITGNLTSGSQTVASISSASGILPGEVIAASGAAANDVQSNAIITAIHSSAPLSLSMSLSSLGTVAGANLIIVKHAPVIYTTGNLSYANDEITNVSPASALSAANLYVTNPNLQDNTAIVAILGGNTYLISQNSNATQNSAALGAGFSPPATQVSISGQLSSGSKTVTNVSTNALPEVGTTVQGYGIPVGTIISSVAGGSLTLSQSATLSGTQSLHPIYAPCPGPATAIGTTTPGGFYASPNAYPAASSSPILQHVPASVASAIPSQIWPQPKTAGTGLASAGSSPDALQGNYIDQRDNQFPNLHFPDQYGNSVKFNVLVFQVLPYIYTNGATCTGTNATTGQVPGATCQYGMLFEGAKGCYEDIFGTHCTMQGVDEWWNPPVAVTMDCDQTPL